MLEQKSAAVEMRVIPAMTLRGWWRRRLSIALTLLVSGFIASACSVPNHTGTAWGDGAFASNGEQIYFTATSLRDTQIDNRGGPGMGGMMMGGQLTCASCHGPDARGGRHVMGMNTMDAPDIRWETLTGHGEGAEPQEGDEPGHAEADGPGYDIASFRTAVIEGLHADGEPLDADMPRWQMTDADLRDLVDYLQSL